jgi:hypothetical protein
VMWVRLGRLRDAGNVADICAASWTAKVVAVRERGVALGAGDQLRMDDFWGLGQLVVGLWVAPFRVLPELARAGSLCCSP